MKILWIKTSPLHPLNRGGDLRTFHMLKAMNARHEVDFCALVSTPAEEEGAKSSHLYAAEREWIQHRLPEHGSLSFYWGAIVNHLTSELPYAVDRFVNASWAAVVQALLEKQTYDVVVCDFLFPSASLLEILSKPRQQPWVVFQHNVEAKIWERRANCASSKSRFYWQTQYRRMWNFEQKACSKFDGVIAVSDKDASIFRQEMKLTNVLGSVPTGVDLAYFQQTVAHDLPKVDLVFLGSMDWHANVDGILWFLQEIWPQLLRRCPEMTLRVVGRSPSAELIAAAKTATQVEVTGTVPDVRPYLQAARMAIVPLRIGGGTRIKIFECMAAGLPVVSTRVGAEGLELEDESHLLYGDNPEAFAAQVLRGLEDEVLSGFMVENALQLIQQHYSWDAAAKAFETQVEAVL